MTNFLNFKWGSLKGWKVKSKAAQEALQAFLDVARLGASAMMNDALSKPEKDLLCAVIDAVAAEEGGELWNDWNGVTMTADEAKHYVRSYGE